MTGQARLATAWWEADRHARTLATDLRDWRASPAPDLETLETDPER